MTALILPNSVTVILRNPASPTLPPPSMLYYNLSLRVTCYVVPSAGKDQPHTTVSPHLVNICIITLPNPTSLLHIEFFDNLILA